MALVSVLGAGPHGKQIAADLGSTFLFDDALKGYEPTAIGARLRPWIAGALWPEVRRAIVAGLPNDVRAPYRHGVYKAPSAVTGAGAKAGAHVHILAGAIVAHGCILDDFVTIATGATLCGEVHVCEGAFVGAGAVIVHGGITIGAGAMVGAGAVVLEDVPPGAVVMGNPARAR